MGGGAGVSAGQDDGSGMSETEESIFRFLCLKYTQQYDVRQKPLGLQYIQAETHNLARELTIFFRAMMREQDSLAGVVAIAAVFLGPD